MSFATMQTVLVTGASGFVGQKLLGALGRDFGEIHAFRLEENSGISAPSGVQWHRVDITDRDAVTAAIKKIRPTVVFHLAAQSHVPTSFKIPGVTWRVNLDGTRHMLDAVAQTVEGAIFINVASADIYGHSFTANREVSESTPLLPLNPYAASKAAADLAAYQYSATSSLRIVRARPFNHSGAGQLEKFVLPAFAYQIARIEAGLSPPVIDVGDLSAERDFLHVSDVIDAYLLMVEKVDQIPGGSAFNIASGSSCTIESLLDLLLSKSRLSIEVRRDPERLRPSDIKRVCGSSQALQNITGWRPRVSKAAMLEDVLNFCRRNVFENQ